MTVIAGLTTNIGEPAVVIGADKGHVIHQKDDCIELLLSILDKNSLKIPLPFILEFLHDTGIDKVTFGMGRKIYISNKNISALAQTGFNDPTAAKARKVLLQPEEFLKDEELLRLILRPIPTSADNTEEYFKTYRQEFDLNARIIRMYVPEIRRIFEIDSVKSKSLKPWFNFMLYDRNFNPTFSEYIYAKVMDTGEGINPILFYVSPTGTIHRVGYTTNGSGGDDALIYMRKRLGTRSNHFGGETDIEIKIDIPKAVDIVAGAINYANKHHIECKGLEYVIVTNNAVETHFSDEQRTYKVGVRKIIDSEIKKQERLLKALHKVRELYIKQK